MKLIFDLDGTLVDSLPDIHAAVAAALAAHGKPPLTADVVRSFIGNGAPVLLDRVAAVTGLAGQEEALLQAFLAHYTADPYRLTRPYEGVSAALDQLRAAGHVMAVCTNKPEGPALDVLNGLGLAGFFDAVVGGDTLSVRKPDPRALTATLSRIGGGAALYVGDSEVDAETAERAALPFLLFTRGYRQRPETQLVHLASFDHYTALPALVARHASGG